MRINYGPLHSVVGYAFTYVPRYMHLPNFGNDEFKGSVKTVVCRRVWLNLSEHIIVAALVSLHMVMTMIEAWIFPRPDQANILLNDDTGDRFIHARD